MYLFRAIKLFDFVLNLNQMDCLDLVDNILSLSI